MKQAILISIQPKYVRDILNGSKKIEIRKIFPSEILPLDVYIYCTKSKRWNLERTAQADSKGNYYKISKKGNENDSLNGKIVAKFTLKTKDSYLMEYVKDKQNLNFITKMDYHKTLKPQPCAGDFLITDQCPQNEQDNSYLLKNSCLTFDELGSYVGYGFHFFHAWHIENLAIFETPKNLKEFNVNIAPQSWQYILEEV